MQSPSSFDGTDLASGTGGSWLTPHNQGLLALLGLGIVGIGAALVAAYLYTKEDEVEHEETVEDRKEINKEPTSMAELVASLKESFHITSPLVADALLFVDRANFVKDCNPYKDAAQPIGFNATISAPHIVHSFNF
jgi:hypothetical protein